MKIEVKKVMRLIAWDQSNFFVEARVLRDLSLSKFLPEISLVAPRELSIISSTILPADLITESTFVLLDFMWCKFSSISYRLLLMFF